MDSLDARSIDDDGDISVDDTDGKKAANRESSQRRNDGSDHQEHVIIAIGSRCDV